MSFLLYHESTTHGMVATPGRIGHIVREPRTYHHEGHFLAVDGSEEDVAEILKIAGYRLATPIEQEKYEKQQRASTSISEARVNKKG